MSFLSIMMKYFPHVLPTVVAIESAIGKSATGTTKKQIVMDAVTQAARQIGETVDDSHVKAISTLIDTTVTALNASGLLGTPAPKPPAQSKLA